jgi:hypothetical protein
MDGPTTSYDYYVVAYRALATILVLDVEELWRRAWTYRPGAVRAALTDIISETHLQRAGEELPSGVVIRLRSVADLLFQTERAATVPNKDALIATWRAVLR